MESVSLSRAEAVESLGSRDAPDLDLMFLGIEDLWSTYIGAEAWEETNIVREE